jgi:hypothetical protein
MYAGKYEVGAVTIAAKAESLLAVGEKKLKIIKLIAREKFLISLSCHKRESFFQTINIYKLNYLLLNSSGRALARTFAVCKFINYSKAINAEPETTKIELSIF